MAISVNRHKVGDIGQTRTNKLRIKAIRPIVAITTIGEQHAIALSGGAGAGNSDHDPVRLTGIRAATRPAGAPLIPGIGSQRAGIIRLSGCPWYDRISSSAIIRHFPNVLNRSHPPGRIAKVDQRCGVERTASGLGITDLPTICYVAASFNCDTSTARHRTVIALIGNGNRISTGPQISYGRRGGAI